MTHYLEPKEKVLQDLGTDAGGLSSAEAAKRAEQYGRNKLAEGKKESLLHRFLSQLADPMIIILLVAAVISAVTTIVSNQVNGGGESFADVFIILFVVILNAVLGVIQESKAEAAIEALKDMTAATSKVLRDGKQITVRSEELVPGDIILLEAGDSVPADCRILECASLKIEEAALTGESVPVEKTDDVVSHDGKEVPLGDRRNMCYMGSTAVYGRGTAVVCGTGKDRLSAYRNRGGANPAAKKTCGTFRRSHLDCPRHLCCDFRRGNSGKLRASGKLPRVQRAA